MAIRNLLPDGLRSGSAWNPTREMSRLQRRIDRIFDEFFNEPLQSVFAPTRALGEPVMTEEFIPACDVDETDTHYLVSFDLPGIRKDEVRIELQDNCLSISGERKRDRREEQKGRLSRERYSGSFARSFTLPANVNADKVEAHYENGVLQIAVPKVAASAGKQIPIKEGKLIEVKPEKAA